MKVRFTLRAAADLTEIADYLRERDPAASLKVRAAILASLQILALFPEIARRRTTEGVRKLVTPQYRYLVYCSIDRSAGEIAILSIQHPAQRRTHTDA